MIEGGWGEEEEEEEEILNLPLGFHCVTHYPNHCGT